MGEEMTDNKKLTIRKSNTESKFHNKSLQNDETDASIFPDDLKLQDYVFLTNLGVGSSSKVKLALSKRFKERVAVKIVPRKRTLAAMAKEKQEKREIRIYREIIISTLLRHPNIVRLIDFVYDDSFFYLIFEYAEGAQLYDMLLDKGRLDEINARRIFRQILSSVDYIHKNSVVHRDLKIENIIIDVNGNAKLIDFGLSNFYDNKNFLTTFCGSLYFAAPELLKGQMYNGPEIDTWSLGVILFTMLCGFVPFDDKDLPSLQKKIKEGEFEIPRFLSSSAKKLLKRILTTRPSMRISLKEIMENEWVNENYTTNIENYVNKRAEVECLDEITVNILEHILSFQFPTIKTELKRYLDHSNREEEEINEGLMLQNPIIALYHLLLENKSENSAYEAKKLSAKNILPENIKGFVKYITGNMFVDKEKGFQNINIIENKKEEEAETIPAPSIRKSFVQGIFRGISTRKFKTENEIRGFISSFCETNKIKLEPLTKNYFGAVKSQNSASYFKISLFYNVIFKTYVISLKFLCGEEDLFDTFKLEFKKQVEV